MKKQPTRREAIKSLALGTLGLSFSTNAYAGSFFPKLSPSEPISSSSSDKSTSKPQGLQYAILDADTGDLLRQKDADQKRQPASLTKLMVLCVAFEAIKREDTKFNLGTTVIAPKEAERKSVIELTKMNDIATFWLMEGGRYRARLLLKAIGSRSDAASTIALVNHMGEDKVLDWGGDFQNRYNQCVKRMNEFASNIGMNNTHFNVITGTPDQNNFSTPHDIALLVQHMQETYPNLCEYALGNPWSDVRPLSRQKHHSSLAIRHNPDEIQWSKTGYTDEAGWCESAYANIDGKPMIGVVFGAANKHQRHKILMQEFHNAASAPADQIQTADINLSRRSLIPGLT